MKGDIYHVLKASEDGFTFFGEAYFTQIKRNETKGWKKHTQMLMNLVVPVGQVTFHIWDDDNQQGYNINLSKQSYRRISIPKNYWVSFTGHDEFNLILNIASIEHSQEEAVNAPLNAYPIDIKNFPNL